MTAGFQPTLTVLNNQVGGIVVAVRNDMQAVLNWNAYITACGGAAYLEGLGMTDGDAATVIAAIGNHATLATAYQGNGIIAAEFDFMANGEPLWGGQ
jgi:hypothetical protein